MRGQVFERDLGADKAVARLRLAGALIVGAASVVLGLGGGGSIRWVWVSLGLLASLGWIAAYARSRRPNPGDRLELGLRSLKMRYGAEENEVEWARLKAVVADEDRLHVRLELETGELVIPLVWRGVGLHELAEHIESARTAAEPRIGDAPSANTP